MMDKIFINGQRLAFERRGNGLPLLLIHGYPLDHTIWQPVASLLEKDFTLILPDMRGFGESQVTEAGCSMADLTADAVGLLDHLKIEKAFIAGHSMGGYIALAFAHAYPRRVLGLGLVSSQALADTPEKKAGRLQEADHILASGVRETAEGMSAKLTADPDLQTVLKKLILRQPPAALAGALRAMAERPDSTPFLPGFNFPLVVVHGLADQLVPVERARQVSAIAKECTLMEIEGAGHMPMMEAPQATAKALRKLLS